MVLDDVEDGATEVGAAQLSKHRTFLGRSWSEPFAIIAAAIGYLSLVAYSYGSDGVYSVQAFSSISVPTALALLSVAVATLMIHPKGWTANLLGHTMVAGATRPLLLAAVVLPPLVGLLQILGQQAGLYGTTFGVALLVVATAGIIIGVIGFVAHRLDLSEHALADAHQKELELQAAKDEAVRLVEVAQTTQEAVNTMAHELSTPMTPMKLRLGILMERSETMSEMEKDCINVMSRNLSRLERLLRDLLDSARLDSGRMQLNELDMDLQQLLQHVVETWSPVAVEHDIHLGLDDSLDVQVHADRMRLDQVLTNLVSNAIKYTSEGGSIRIRTAFRAGGVEIAIEDDGRGLDAEEAERLFRPFTQLEGARQEKLTGTGLGLHISKGIAELHGGRLSCESKGRGQGTTFRLWLPGDRVVHPQTFQNSVTYRTTADRTRDATTN